MVTASFAGPQFDPLIHLTALTAQIARTWTSLLISALSLSEARVGGHGGGPGGLDGPTKLQQTKVKDVGSVYPNACNSG